MLENPLVYQYKPRQRVDRKGKIYFVEEYESSRAVQNQIKFFLYLAMFTGCRCGELIALRWSDIDFESSSVKVTKMPHEWEDDYENHKDRSYQGNSSPGADL